MKEELETKTEELKKSMGIYENFPKPGVKFCDIFSIVGCPKLLHHVVDIFQEKLKHVNYQKIFMLESRGFLLGVPLSMRVNKPSYPIRKKGKLPGELVTVKYDLEYGTDEIQLQKISIRPGDRVVLVDDVLATGGTLNAAIKLVQQAGGQVAAIMLFNIVKDLKGIDKLAISKQKVFYIFQV